MSPRCRDAGSGERGSAAPSRAIAPWALHEEPAVVVPAQDLAAPEDEDPTTCWPAVAATTPSAGCEPSTDASQSMTSGVTTSTARPRPLQAAAADPGGADHVRMRPEDQAAHEVGRVVVGWHAGAIGAT